MAGDGARRDPRSSLRALREQASDLAARTLGGSTAAPGAAAAASGAGTAVATVAPPDEATVASPVPPAVASRPAPVAAPAHSSRAADARRRQPRVRKARLRLLRVDPWSVMKVSFLLSIAAGIALVVAVAALWSILDAAGVFTSVGSVVQEVTASEANAGIDITQYVALSRVVGFTTLLAVVDVVLITALATIGAFLYNLTAALLGGLEVTLAEDD